MIAHVYQGRKHHLHLLLYAQNVISTTFQNKFVPETCLELSILVDAERLIYDVKVCYCRCFTYVLLVSGHNTKH